MKMTLNNSLVISDNFKQLNSSLTSMTLHKEYKKID